MSVHDLGELLATLKVVRHPGVWMFESTPSAPASDAIMMFREREGVTMIRPADDTAETDNLWVWLELAVYSALNAVGFMAAIAEALKQADVPCNAVAAYHHDHVFVPLAKAEAAIEALEALSGVS